MMGGFQEVEFDFVADNPGLTLFHCHQQLHMDFGFMALFNLCVSGRDHMDKETKYPMPIGTHSARDRQTGSRLEVLLVFLKLGVTCFGGPIAHIGYFREEFVVRRRWLTKQRLVFDSK